MSDLSDALVRARALDVDALARSIQRLGFECTRCGACCRGTTDEPHTATVAPDEVRTLQEATGGEWRDVARPIPYGLDSDDFGETFEWALNVDDCGDCTFLDEQSDGKTSCSVYSTRPGICRTYPFQIDLAGTTAPSAEVVDADGQVLAYECEGLGEPMSMESARDLAQQLKRRTVREIQEATAVLERYDPDRSFDAPTIVHDSEGPKRPDGRPLSEP